MPRRPHSEGNLRHGGRRRNQRWRVDRAFAPRDQGALVVAVREPANGPVPGGNEQQGSRHPARSHAGRHGEAGHRSKLQIRRYRRGDSLSGRRTRARKSGRDDGPQRRDSTDQGRAHRRAGEHAGPRSDCGGAPWRSARRADCCRSSSRSFSIVVSSSATRASGRIGGATISPFNPSSPASGSASCWNPAFTAMLACAAFFAVLAWCFARRQRWAWITLTILSFNPVAWLINLIYLGKRWAEASATERAWRA